MVSVQHVSAEQEAIIRLISHWRNYYISCGILYYFTSSV